MRRILGAAIGLLSLAGAAHAQEVPLGTYVGDGATDIKAYATGFMACDVATNTCKLGNGSQAWADRDAIGGSTGSFYPTSGDVGLDDDTSPDNVISTWTPVATGFARIKAIVTSGSALIINPPTGTLGTGVAPKTLHVTNSTAGPVSVTFAAGYTLPANYLTDSTIAPGEAREYVISTDDTGTTWYVESGVMDLDSLPTVTLDVGDLVLVQSTAPVPDTWGKASIQEIVLYIQGILAIDGTQVGYTTRTLTATGPAVLADVGKIVLCNSATAMTLQLDTSGITWPATGGSVIYVENIGAGKCTIAGAGTVPMAVNNPFATAALSQWQRATIRIISDTTVSVGGGFDPS